MHAIQGALAVRREREKREKRRLSRIERAKSPRSSDASNLEEGEIKGVPQAPPPKGESSLTAFHLGVVFILLGFLMVFSAMITNSMVEGDMSSLLGVGVTFIIVGLIMVMVNRIITAKEEEELAKYVSHRLARTRSGYQLGRDLDEHHPFQQHHQRSTRQSHRASSRRPSTAVRRGSTVPPAAAAGNSVSPRSAGGAGITTSASNTHLAVKNGHDFNGIKAAESGSGIPVEVVNADVVVTETETLLPKKHNKPALIVTKESLRRPSKS